MLNSTPKSERLTIAFFGKRNAGKSSLLNAVTNQEIAVVSDIAGTTTDPVTKAMELLPLGPVTVIDTPGFDDSGALGEKRVQKTREILEKTDIAVLVVAADDSGVKEPAGKAGADTAAANTAAGEDEATAGEAEANKELIKLLKERKIPYIIAYTKADLLSETPPKKKDNEIFVSSLSGENINELKEMLGALAPKEKSIRLVGDFIKKGDTVVLVTPIDESAPKARLILPQQQAIRDILDARAVSVVVQPSELEKTLSSFKEPPALVICDSQVFKAVAKIVPPEIPLCSFSILFARYKGLLKAALPGAMALDKLKDGDTLLISEGCTHHRQCNDIGTKKLPAWISEYTKKDLNFEFTSGGGFPQEEELKDYALIVHCGGCMLTDKEILYRQEKASSAGVPITNYGLVIAKMNGILERATEIIMKLC